MRSRKWSLRKRILVGIMTLVVVLTAAFAWNEYMLHQAQLEFIQLLETEQGNYNEDRVVLSATTQAEAQRMTDEFGGTLRITDDGRFAVINLPEGTTLTDIAKEKSYRKYHDRILLDYNNFRTAEEIIENAEVRASYQVNDAMYPQQTYLDYINIGDTWNLSRGKTNDDEKITVAIIDSGIDTDHPEFIDAEGNSIISPQSYDATNDQVVDQYGISVIEDENGHGTAVAGVIAAQMNGVGTIGIAPDVELLVIKCEVDETGEFKSSADIVFAIYYAIEMDADVINMSLGGDDSKDMESALQLAVDSDIICVAAAGNDTTDVPHYPAAYDTVIGVGALADDSWEIADYSNYGINSDIMAPGTALTTNMGGEYTYQEGTSIAAPMVSASVALYLSQNEYATYDTVKAELEAAGSDLGDLGEDESYGFGALDLNAFVCEEKGIITYDYCTEGFEDTTQIFVRQHTIQTVPEPERENVVFDDWYYDKAYTRVFDYDAWYSTEFVEDITLYAKWVNEDDEGASVYNYRTLGDGTIEIGSYKGKRRYLTIPNEIDGKIVSSIGANAFSGNTRLREVIFPEGLVYIKANAFKGVTKMRDITFTGTQLQEIQGFAFFGCSSLKALDLPDSVRILGESVFANCTAMTAVNISADSQLERIDDAAFSNTKITSFYLPANVGADGFNGSVLAYCSSMRSISVHGENTGFYVSDKSLYDAAGTKIVYYPAALTGSYAVADDVVTIGKYAFAGSCISDVDLNQVMTIEENAFESTRNLSAVILPDSVTSLGSSAFALSSITQVRISENLTAIAAGAFSDTKLTSVFIPAKVQTIGIGAFNCCARLKKLSFAENAGLTVIGESAFESCGLLGSFTLPDSLQTIASNAFYKCASITELMIPVNVSKIGKEAFRYCTRLQNITFADGCVLTTVPESCFANCTMLQTVSFSDAITTLGRSAFSNDYLLRELDFNETSALTTIRDQCFYSCSMLQTMQLPDRVSTIGEFAYTFSGLAQVDISAGITSIGNAAFGGCYSLSQIDVDENNPSYAAVDNVLFNKDITTVYCVPSTRTGTYTLPDTVVVTAPYSFYYDILLSGVVLPEGLADIQQNSFYNCSSLAGVEIPANVTNIGREAFYDCYLLKDVSFSSGSKLQRLGIYTFVNCGMTDITIPASVEEIAQYVFYNCRNLKEITFEANSALTYVAAYLFRGTKVETVVFEEGSALNSLQAHAFDSAYYLKHVDFGDAAITNVDNYAFYNCSALEDILIPDSVTYIGRYAFYNCAKLDRMDLPAGMDYIGESAFRGTNNMKVYFAGTELPANVQFGWDNGISGYFLDAVDYIITDEWEYAVSASGTISLADYKGDAAELTIDTVDGYTVAKIGVRCFAGNDTLTSISLSDNITEIGNYAFYDCNGLNSVTIPASVTRIGRYAFAASSAIISFADNSELRSIDDYAFSENATTEMDIPDSVTEIGDGAFVNSTLSVLTISDSSCLESIGSEAFVGSSIASVNLPETLSHVGEGAFKNVTTLTDVTIADGDTALKLSHSAFEGSGISEITIPARVYYIGEYTFSSCPNLQNIHVDSANESYTELDGVLCDVYGTTLIQYPSGRSGGYEVPQQITVLAYASFKNAKSLTEVSFAEGSAVKTIGWQTFSGCESLAKITVPDSVVSFDFYAFENCTSLTDVILTDNSQLSGVYEGAFYGCSALTNLTLPDTVTEIGDYAFYNCESLTAVPLSVSATVKGIYDYAFYGCSGITEVPAFSQLVEIGEYAFAYTGVETYTVKASVKEIAPSAFVGCEAFTAISCDEANTEYTAIDGGLYEKGADSADDYDALVIWPYARVWILGEGKTELTSSDTRICNILPYIQYEIANTVTSIGDDAFYRCNSLTSITIPESVTSIGSTAFFGCSSLKTAGPIGGGYDYEFGWKESIPAYAFRGCSSLTSITIPEGVTSIGDYAFRECSSLTRITIPEGVTSIVGYAFYGCSSLTSITIPNGVTNIGDYAFRECSRLMSITIPSGVTGIGDYVFYGCSSLTSITIPSGVTSIGDYAFRECSSLTSITIPNGVTSIGDYAFRECSSLTSIKFLGDAPIIISVYNGAFYGVTATVYYSCYSDTWAADVMRNYDGNLTWVSFDPCPNGHAVVIDEAIEASCNYGLTEGSHCSVCGTILVGQEVIPAISDHSFTDGKCVSCGLERIAYGTCGANANWLLSTDGVLYIYGSGEMAGYSSGSAPWYSYRANINRIILGNKITNIVSYAFNDCTSLVSITIPEGVTSIGDYAFRECSRLMSITIPESVTSIGKYAFYGCSRLTRITIPSGVTSIGEGVFAGCSRLTRITIPSGVTSIGYSAFNGCSSLTSITIPNGVTSIDSYAFYLCRRLTSITFPGDAPTIRSNAFYGVTATVYYSCYSDTWTTDVMQNYGGTLTWVSFDPCPNGHTAVIDIGVEASCVDGLTEGSHCSVCGTILVVQEVIPAISDHSFTDGKCVSCGLELVANGTCGANANWLLFADGELYIYGSGEMAEYSRGSAPWYSYRKNIKRINLGNKITNIGSYAFYNCTKLASITIPEGVTSIGNTAFDGCLSLTSITIPDGVTSIGNFVFSGCLSLTSITIPDSVTSIGDYAFQSCSNLTSITIPEGVTRIGIYAFYGCRSLTSITIPYSVTSIGNSAFSGCRSLTSITFPGDAPTIRSNAFSGVTATVYYSCYSDTWTIDVMQNYGGTLTWVSYDPCEDGHTTDEAVVENEVAATCTQDGSYDSVTYCAVCKAELNRQTVTITAKGHNYEAVVTAPRCTEGGYTTYTCSVCGGSYIADEVEALGHSFTGYVSNNDATCTADGTETAKCDRCDVTDTRTEEGSAKGHTSGEAVKENEVAATCTQDGSYDSVTYCAACKAELNRQTVTVTAKGHSYESAVTAPTCTAQGYTTHTCVNCGDSYVDTYVEALGHDMGEWTTVTEATCTEDGSESRDCSRCDHYEIRAIEAAGHSYEDVVTAPACTEQGFVTHTCSVCGDSYVDTYVDALGHDIGEWTTVKEATCTEDGSEHRDCSRCDHTETRTIKATGHSFGAWFVNRVATCTEEGENRRNCNDCSHYETEAIPATGHSYESIVTAPTCTEQGYTTHTCSACGDSYVDAYVDALGHDMGEWTTVTEATCTEGGQELRECVRCDRYETRIIEAPGHSYHAAVTKPTCTEQGYTQYICSVCGDSYISDYMAPTGHEYDEVVTDPTCTEQGYTTYTCHCGDCYISDYTDPLGHDMGAWEISNNATCTEDGQELRECSRCDYSEIRTVEALGHEWDAGVVTVEPTEETEGEMTYTCERCSETRTEIIPTLEHEHCYDAVVTAPTCTEQGYTTHTCRCGDSYVDSYMDALGHDMGEWFLVTEPTCTADGLEQRDCSRCDYHETQVIEATGHDYESVVTDPTCIAQGFTTHTCHCGDSYTDSYTAALGHSFTEYASDGNATCTQDGTKTSVCDHCDATDTVADEGSALGHDFTEWIVVQKPTETVEGLESRYCLNCGVEETRAVACLVNPFADVPFGSFYYEPVLWAVEKGITNGTSATTFGPNDQCMRAHVVTFLWRAVGSPEPTQTDNPFVDVKPLDFYYKPVLWALENGITSGMDATHFGPTSYCNRAQVVTFLYRTMGNPALESTDNPFDDVQAGSFYEKPVLWAVENGITNGLSATAFGPNTICNRAQIVTFLYRAFVAK